jgi:hypothetical protein
MSNFGQGVLIAMTGNNGGFEQCLPPAWKVNNPAVSAAANEGLSNTVGSKNKDLFSTIINVVKTGISMACKFKAKIVSFFQSKLGKRLRRRRFFMMMRTTKGRNKMRKWFVSSIENAAKSVGNFVSNTASSVGNAVVSGAQAVGNAVVQGAEFVGNAILDGATAIFNAIVEPVKKIYTFFNNFFRSDLFTQTKDFLMCLSTKIQTLVKNIQNFIKAVADLLTGWKGFIKIFIGAICNWQLFFQAITFLIQGIDGVGAAKWMSFGKFVGQLVVAIGTADTSRR